MITGQEIIDIKIEAYEEWLNKLNDELLDYEFNDRICPPEEYFMPMYNTRDNKIGALVIHQYIVLTGGYKSSSSPKPTVIKVDKIGSTRLPENEQNE